MSTFIQICNFSVCLCDCFQQNLVTKIFHRVSGVRQTGAKGGQRHRHTVNTHSYAPAQHWAKILPFCAETRSIFKDSSALSAGLCTPRGVLSLSLPRLIKCGYNQGLIVYWSPLWDTRVLNNAVPRALMQQQGPFIEPASGASHCCRAVIRFGAGQPCLSPLPDSRDSAPLRQPSPLTCFALTHLFSFLLIKWSDKVGALSHYKP